MRVTATASDESDDVLDAHRFALSLACCALTKDELARSDEEEGDGKEAEDERGGRQDEISHPTVIHRSSPVCAIPNATSTPGRPILTPR